MKSTASPGFPESSHVSSLDALMLVSAIVATLVTPMARADVKLPDIFGSHMVLQQQMPIAVWGQAAPGEQITVRLSDASRRTTADATGKWRVSLPAMKAGGPCTMTVTGPNTVTFDDVVIGEVWVCSGQSNMEMGISMCLDGKQEIATAKYPSVRLMMVPRNPSATPQDNIVAATWSVCSPETIGRGGWGGFSAAAYFFGRELQKSLNVPIGLVDASWGGTRIETWTPAHAFAEIPSLKGICDQVALTDPRSAAHKQRLAGFLAEMDKWTAKARLSMDQEKVVVPVPAFPKELNFQNDAQFPTALYNGMIHPLVPFGIRGAIWYQGEANQPDGMEYLDKMKALVGGWRRAWGEGDFPFYYVQIAPYEYDNEPSYILPGFWEAQTAAMRAIPNTGMVVTTDIGDPKNIHPRNKQEVGRRLALWALAKTYGRQDVVCSGPTFQSLKTEGSKVRLHFDNSGGGLVSRDGKPLSNFEVVDRDRGGFVPATAIIDGEQLVLSADGVANPVAVRFAWNKLAEPNLANRQGLPAVPFRAGEVPRRDALR
jgi:sialate O-acetylesterase